jgi:transposase
MNRIGYPSDVSDEEWAFAAPYLTLMSEAAPQREHSLREVFNGLRWIIRTGAPWRMLPHDLPPWIIVYQQTRRWLEAGAFDALVADLRLLLRMGTERTAERGAPGQPHAAIDARERRTSRLRRAQAPQRLEGSCGGGYLGTPPGAARHPRQRTGSRPGRHAGSGGAGGDWRARHAGIRRPRVHRTGANGRRASGRHRVEVVKLPTARQGFVLLPKRWVVEVVHPQMTKPNGGTVAGGGEDVADLHVTIGDNDAVNEELDKRAPLLEGRLVQPVANLGAKRLERRCDRAQRDVLLRHGVELPLLTLQSLLPAGQFVALALKDRQGEDARQIGVEQALLRGVELDQGMPQRRLAGLELLGQPVATMRAA